MFNVESGKGYGMPHSNIREVHLFGILAIGPKRPGVHYYNYNYHNYYNYYNW